METVTSKQLLATLEDMFKKGGLSDFVIGKSFQAIADVVTAELGFTYQQASLKAQIDAHRAHRQPSMAFAGGEDPRVN